jgi:competence protein ComEC
LLTGDVEADGLEAMLKEGGDYSCTVFKAPHHGSKYAFNQAFYMKANPKIVVFSVGRNSFGHPAPELIEYWEEQGATIYRTDYDGAITLLTDGKKLEVRTMGREVF